MLACVQAAFARAVFVWSWSLDVVCAGARLIGWQEGKKTSFFFALAQEAAFSYGQRPHYFVGAMPLAAMLLGLIVMI